MAARRAGMHRLPAARGPGLVGHWWLRAHGNKPFTAEQASLYPDVLGMAAPTPPAPMTTMQRKPRRNRNRGRNGFLLALGGLILAVLITVASLVGYVLAIAASAPDISELKPDDKGESSVIFAADGSRLGYVQSDEIRTPIPWKAMPQDIRDAVVAVEDERFYEHEGVDYSAIVRAAVKNIRSGKNVEGGSTITQQLVRALYIKDPKRTFKRKIREAKLASELEKEHSKEWILKSYLNDVPFGTVEGRTAIGIEAAAETFFDKHARNLDLGQAALLAGLPQAPSQYNPFRNPTAALPRRGEVLPRMDKNDFLTQAGADEESAQRLGVKQGTRYN
ncbi:MAG: transglycosylase domain-containing protein, partial [Thermoleophilaceae bacterium]